MDFVLLVSTSKIENPNCPKALLLCEETNILGRSTALKLDTSRSHEVSKKHATIFFNEVDENPTWVIEDRDSLNGTFLNGRKIKKRTLCNFDEIVIGGGSDFRFGDVLITTDTAECRFAFIQPPPPIWFASDSNKDEVLLDPDDCEDCPICYLPMAKRAKLPCDHCYCKNCLREWSEQCQKEKIDFCCPICRKLHDIATAVPPPVVFDSGVFIVNNVEPFLRKVGMKSVAEVKELSIMVPWDPSRKERFWATYEIVKTQKNKLEMFRWLTQCSYREVKDASEEELAHAVENLEGEAAGDLRGTVLWLVANKLHVIEDNRELVALRARQVKYHRRRNN